MHFISTTKKKRIIIKRQLLNYINIFKNIKKKKLKIFLIAQRTKLKIIKTKKKKKGKFYVYVSFILYVYICIFIFRDENKNKTPQTNKFFVLYFASPLIYIDEFLQ